MGGYIIAIITILAVIYYTYTLVDKVKVSKNDILKILREAIREDSFKLENIKMKKIDEVKIEDSDVSEITSYRIAALSSSEVNYDLEFKLYNPEADIEAEEYQAFKKSTKAQDNATDSILSGSPDSSGAATIESAQSMMQEQSEREAQDKLIKAKVLKHELGIKVARILSEKSHLIPEIYFYDRKKIGTLNEYPGDVLLKDYFLDANDEGKQQILNSVVNGLAKIHNTFDEIYVYLPPRRDMEPEDFRNILKLGLDNLYEARILSLQQKQELLNEYYTIGLYLSDGYLKNIKLNDFTPYKIRVNKDKIYVNDFYTFDTAPQLTNVVEFIKDPIIYSQEREKEALASYFNLYDSNLDYQDFIKYYHLFSCHILTVQLFFMKLFIKKTENLKDEVEDTEGLLVNWNQDHFDLLYNDAKEVWSQYEESRHFVEKLEEIMGQLDTVN